MKIEDHWVEKEMQQILKERKNKTERSSFGIKAIFLLSLTIISFFCFSFQAFEPNYTIAANDGVSWRCTRCGKHCWSNQRDWRGNYYCNSCGQAR